MTNNERFWGFLSAVLVLTTGQMAQAGPLTGGISFSGRATSYLSTNATGALASDFTQAHSIAISSTTVGSLPSGSFHPITGGTSLVMATPIQVNPPVVPAGPLWTVGNFSFYATSISTISVSRTTLELKAMGVLTDGNPADSALGTWTGIFSEVLLNGGSSVTDPPPKLSITMSGTNAQFNWPTNSIGLIFSVQTTTNFVPPFNWVALASTPVLVSNQWVLTNTASGSGQLFRLVH